VKRGPNSRRVWRQTRSFYDSRRQSFTYYFSFLGIGDIQWIFAVCEAFSLVNDRHLRVLEALSNGADTRHAAQTTGYTESRTRQIIWTALTRACRHVKRFNSLLDNTSVLAHEALFGVPLNTNDKDQRAEKGPEISFCSV
jgi:hypothetical protein